MSKNPSDIKMTDGMKEFVVGDTKYVGRNASFMEQKDRFGLPIGWIKIQKGIPWRRVGKVMR